jgi:hypothetical protein
VCRLAGPNLMTERTNPVTSDPSTVKVVFGRDFWLCASSRHLSACLTHFLWCSGSAFAR